MSSRASYSTVYLPLNIKSGRYMPVRTSGANCVRVVSFSGVATSGARRPQSAHRMKLRLSRES
jgi:hypothetical protein